VFTCLLLKAFRINFYVDGDTNRPNTYIPLRIPIR